MLQRARGLYAAPASPRADDDLLTTTRRLRAVASHDTAAAWWRLDVAHEPEPEHQLTVPRTRGRRVRDVPGVRLHRTDLRPEDVTTHGGLQVTTVLRTCLDLARTLPSWEAVAVADGALRRGLTTSDALTSSAATARGPGAPSVSAVAALVDPRAESVLESLLRVRLSLAGLAPTCSQHHALADGRPVRLDLAWADLWLAVEADGFAHHSDRESYRSDRRRLTGLAADGWSVLRFSWEDVVGQPDEVVAVTRRAITTATALRGRPWPDGAWTRGACCAAA